MNYKIYLCPVELPYVDPNPDCPRRELHTPHPPGYVERSEWASSLLYKGHKSRRCPGCHLYTIWSPTPP